MKSFDIEPFVQAFSSDTSSLVITCDCGKTYYSSLSSDEGSYEDGELERLEKNANAVAHDGYTELLGFEGKFYAGQCECWQERAQMIMGFVFGHGYQIAAWLSLHKAELREAAEGAPVGPETVNDALAAVQAKKEADVKANAPGRIIQF